MTRYPKTTATRDPVDTVSFRPVVPRQTSETRHGTRGPILVPGRLGRPVFYRQQGLLPTDSATVGVYVTRNFVPSGPYGNEIVEGLTGPARRTPAETVVPLGQRTRDGGRRASPLLPDTVSGHLGPPRVPGVCLLGPRPDNRSHEVGSDSQSRSPSLRVHSVPRHGSPGSRFRPTGGRNQ